MATYLITDTYFKEQYPSWNQLDMSKFYSVLLIEQDTTIEDWVGTVLYAWLIDNAGGTFTNEEQEFLDQIQYILVFASALGLIALNDTPSSTHSLMIETLRAKLAYLKGKLLGYVESSTDLNDIIDTAPAGSGGGTGSGQLPDHEPFDSVIYYWR